MIHNYSYHREAQRCGKNNLRSAWYMRITRLWLRLAKEKSERFKPFAPPWRHKVSDETDRNENRALLAANANASSTGVKRWIFTHCEWPFQCQQAHANSKGQSTCCSRTNKEESQQCHNLHWRREWCGGAIEPPPLGLFRKKGASSPCIRHKSKESEQKRTLASV